MRQIAPLDPLDDPQPPPGALLRRLCGHPGCRAWARTGGRYCRAHFAAATRAWRDATRRAINARRVDVAAERPPAQRFADSARAKVAMALKRGKLTRKPCVVCARAEVTAYVPAPARWREVIWVCRDDRSAFIEEHREREQVRRTQGAWVDRRAAALAAIAALSPAERASLEEFAARGPAGIRLTPQAPLYVNRLVQAYESRYGVP